MFLNYWLVPRCINAASSELPCLTLIRSLREREQDYGRLRDRIFSSEQGGPSNSSRSERGGPGPQPFPASIPSGPMPPGAAFHSPDAGQRGQGLANRKAVFRNKEQDLQDPDYRRGIDRSARLLPLACSAQHSTSPGIPF